MNNEKSKLLGSYITANVAPILEDFIFGNNIPNSVVIPANINKDELVGHYEETIFLPPKWFSELSITNSLQVLVIDKIDTISKEEQLKFIELLEHRKISTFELPENYAIIVTASLINKDTINEEIFSLVAYIRG
ncbi:MAG: hypothetical protein RSD40_04675 [Bacilli bacterium]